MKKGYDVENLYEYNYNLKFSKFKKQRDNKPLLSFYTDSSIEDINWSWESSTLFAACTSSGKVIIYDLYISTSEPMFLFI
jgi:hypothetical protein